MSGLAAVKKAAALIGAVVEDEKIGAVHTCRVEAPANHRWKIDTVHELVDSAYRPWKPDYADLLSRMDQGVESCPDPDCEWCGS